jgi:hypothetical protein
MGYRMCNYDYDVVYQGLSQSIRHTSECTHTSTCNAEAIKELIEMSETVTKYLKRIKLLEEE